VEIIGRANLRENWCVFLISGPACRAMSPRAPAATLILTVLALAAFAANSLLCRMALRDGAIDPVSFTQVRLGSGALALMPILFAGGWRIAPGRDWRPALALFLYAIGFSLAYAALSVGAGALILFGTVQLSMIGIGLFRGDRPGALGWLGLALAFGGLAYLVAPGVAAPPLWAAALMGLAGLAWGVYSVMGKTEPDPIRSTARNFALTLPAVLLLTAAAPASRHLGGEGVALALASGMAASGLGYVLWYLALRGLSHLAASVGQLSVPVLATLAGALFLGEPLTPRVLIATAVILGGIVVATGLGRRAKG
jgi:drug/metabolite transporter (DMT)-like permease